MNKGALVRVEAHVMLASLESQYDMLARVGSKVALINKEAAQPLREEIAVILKGINEQKLILGIE